MFRSIHLRPLRHQSVHRLRVPSLRGRHQGRATVLGHRVDLRITIKIRTRITIRIKIKRTVGV